MAKSFIANPTTQNGIDYVRNLERLLNTTKKELLVRQQNEIIKVYQKAYLDIIDKGLKKAGGDPKKLDKLTKSYVMQIYDELEDLLTKYNRDISDEIYNLQRQIMYSYFDPSFQEFRAKVDKLVDITNRKVINQMIQGNIYHDGKGLSDRIWDTAKTSGNKMSIAINSCIAQGMGAADMSENLKEFAMGGHHTWSRNKIREKLGDGYARKYGSGGLDYEALRLARTTLTHQAQISVINSSKVNPYMDAVIWHSDHQAGRTCQLCLDRDGTKYYLNKQSVPLDHPNGMCWLEPAYSMTPEEIAKDMKAWAAGEKNSGLMDKIPEYKGLGGKTKKAAKPKAKPKEKVIDYIEKYRKQRRPKPETIEKAKEQIEKIIADNKAKLQKDYKVIVEKDVKKHHKLRGKPNRSDMTKEENFAYDLYVQTGDSFRINRRLYSGEYANNIGKTPTATDMEIDEFTALVAKDKLDDNSRFVRFVGGDYLQTLYNQLDLGEIPKPIQIYYGNGLLDLNANLMDKVITNDAFTSVSYDQKANVFTNKPIMMEIYADKDSECLYTYNYRESEVVLQRGTQFKIKGIEIVHTQDKWGDPISYTKLIMQTVSKK